MNKRMTSLVAVLLVTASLAACGQKQTAPTPQPTTPASTAPPAASPTASPGAAAGGNAPEGAGSGSQTAQAESLFKAQCIACHGADLGGGVGPNLQKAGSRLSEADVKNILLNGRGGMPAFKGNLSDTDIQALAAWLAAKK
ncbi:c-type cytochrome [Paenibacillus chitinolyticus]|uniref:c-type cytochrome n=1 Tax=Paenibacillus chitinolyticus TaxID=79263 RepID=UPI00362DF4B8